MGGRDRFGGRGQREGWREGGDEGQEKREGLGNKKTADEIKRRLRQCMHSCLGAA